MTERIEPGTSLDRALDNYDSKFRFVLLAADRAEQLVRGAYPKMEETSGKASVIAMEEFRHGLIPWDYGPEPQEESEAEADADDTDEDAEEES